MQLANQVEPDRVVRLLFESKRSRVVEHLAPRVGRLRLVRFAVLIELE